MLASSLLSLSTVYAKMLVSISNQQTDQSWFKVLVRKQMWEQRERRGKDCKLSSPRRKRASIVAGREWNHDNRPLLAKHLENERSMEPGKRAQREVYFNPPAHPLTHMKTDWLIVQSQHSLSPFSSDRQTLTMKALFQLHAHNWKQRNESSAQAFKPPLVVQADNQMYSANNTTPTSLHQLQPTSLHRPVFTNHIGPTSLHQPLCTLKSYPLRSCVSGL